MGDVATQKDGRSDDPPSTIAKVAGVFLSGVSPVEVVRAENLHRGHLTASQRAQMNVEAYQWATGGGDRMSEQHKTIASNDAMGRLSCVSCVSLVVSD